MREKNIFCFELIKCKIYILSVKERVALKTNFIQNLGFNLPTSMDSGLHNGFQSIMKEEQTIQICSKIWPTMAANQRSYKQYISKISFFSCFCIRNLLTIMKYHESPIILIENPPSERISTHYGLLVGIVRRTPTRSWWSINRLTTKRDD